MAPQNDNTNGEVMRAIGQLEGKFDGGMRLLSSLVDRIAGIETKMDSRFEEVHDRIDNKDETLGKRLAKVEKRVYVIWIIGGGGFSLLLALISSLSGLF